MKRTCSCMVVAVTVAAVDVATASQLPREVREAVLASFVKAGRLSEQQLATVSRHWRTLEQRLVDAGLTAMDFSHSNAPDDTKSIQAATVAYRGTFDGTTFGGRVSLDDSGRTTTLEIDAPLTGDTRKQVLDRLAATCLIAPQDVTAALAKWDSAPFKFPSASSCKPTLAPKPR